MSQTTKLVDVDDLIKNQKNIFTIINLLAEKPHTTNDVHNKTGIPLSTCYKIINDYKKLGILYRNGMEMRENIIKPIPKYSSRIGNIKLTFDYVTQEHQS